MTLSLPWTSPDVPPVAAGEYRAALDPSDVSEASRRWWDGKAWSKPYLAHWPEQLKQAYRAQVSAFRVYWQPV